MNHANPMMVSAACVSIGLLGRCAPLPLKSDDDFSKARLVTKLLEVMNNVKLPSKTRERAAKTLGLICAGEVFPQTRQVIDGLLKTAKDTKDVEVHFTIGESLVVCVQSIWSSEARDAWTTLPADYHPEHTMLESPPDDDLKSLLDELLKLVALIHPNARQVRKCPSAGFDF